MELYDEVDRRRAARYKRREQRRMREERRRRVLAPIKFWIQVIIGAVLMYLCLFLGMLWATI